MGKFTDWVVGRVTGTRAPSTSDAATALDVAGIYTPSTTLDVSDIGRITGVTREMAKQHPMVVRALNKLLAVVTGLPLVSYDPDGARSSPIWQRRWQYPCGGYMTLRTLLRLTVEDLFFDGQSLWTVEERYSDGLGRPGLPKRYKHRAIGLWSVRVDSKTGNTYYKVYDVDTQRHLEYDAADTVYFDGLDDGLLHTGGAHALVIGLRAQRAVEQSIDTPVPTGFIVPTDGPLTPDQAAYLKTATEEARRASRTAVFPFGVEFKQTALTPRDRQVYDADAKADMGVARATAGSPTDFGIATNSNTYANVQDERTNYLRHDASRFYGVIEDTLSMPAYSGTRTVRFDLNVYTRGSDADRFTAYQIGLEVGVYADEDDVRAAEGLPPLTPAQKRARLKKSAPPPAASPAPPSQGAPAEKPTPPPAQGKEAPAK